MNNRICGINDFSALKKVKISFLFQRENEIFRGKNGDFGNCLKNLKTKWSAFMYNAETIEKRRCFRQILKKVMIKYNFFEDGNLIIIKYPELYNKSQVISFMDFVFNTLHKQSIKKVLIDFRDCEPAFNISGIEDIKKIRLNSFSNVRTIFLVNNSRQTAFATYFSRNIDSISVCSTIEYAIRLLDLKMTTNVLEDSIKKLTFRFE